jgi:uncharacterized iron-regulated membrane protein
MASDNSSVKVWLRKFWLQVHKWIGLILAILIIPISLTGSALVWHDWVDEAVNPERKVSAEASQPAAFYAEAARSALDPGETLLSLTYPDGEGAVLASAARETRGAGGGRPVRTQLYLDPTDGHVLDRSASDAGFVRVMHRLHGSLMVPGVGRQIVGWVGVAMLISSLTGLWLWWPFRGGFTKGFRWQRSPITSGNLHHQFGFWIALPLFVLSLTGAWISFPAFFGALSGEGGQRGGPPGGRGAAAGPLAVTQLGPDQALAAARPLATGPLRSIAWPTERDANWTVSFAREGGNAAVKVDDTSSAVTPPEPPRPETTARLMRRIHDGTDTGAVWQIIVFLGGLIPAGLAVTGIIMWLDQRKRRMKAKRNRVNREAEGAAAT